jgi:hypothetical protein
MITGLLHDAELPVGAGLRIARRLDNPALAMSLAAKRSPGDAVVIEHDARVFLGPVARARLNHQTLDARSGAFGSSFFLRP